MNTPRLTPQGEGCFLLQGELNMHTVPALWRKANALLAGGTGSVAIDLAGVSRADSAGLALLLDWLRQTRAQGRKITFEHLPAQLQAIVNVSGLDEVLPLDVD